MLQGPTRASRCGRRVSALATAVVLAGSAGCRSASELFPDGTTADAGPRGEPATVDTSFLPPTGEALGLRSLSGLVRLPDDRLLLGGPNWVRDRAALVRLLPDGARDPRYGDGGIALSPCSGNLGRVVAWGPAVRSDGSAVLVTYSTTTPGFVLVVASPDGDDVRCVSCPELAPGGRHLVSPDVVGTMALTATPDDAVLVYGVAGVSGATTSHLLLRLSSTCTLDHGFGDGGTVRFAVNGSMVGELAALPDGTIYATGRHGYYEAGLYAFDATGRPLAPDGGRVSLPPELAAVGAMAPAGTSRLAAAGSTNSSSGNQLVHFGVAGPALDTPLTSAPLALTAVGGLALEANGDVLVTGSSAASPCHLVRFRADGSLDTAFPPGLRPQPFTAACDAIAVQSDGRVVLAGPMVQPLLDPPIPPKLVRVWP